MSLLSCNLFFSEISPNRIKSVPIVNPILFGFRLPFTLNICLPHLQNLCYRFTLLEAQNRYRLCHRNRLIRTDKPEVFAFKRPSKLNADFCHMAHSNGDEKILSYEDVVLRRSDLDILRGPYYLNDRIIEFYFSSLSSTYPSQDILLVPPSISFWITNCPDFNCLKDFVEPLQLPSRKLVIFTVNDNADVSQAEGGAHWSLLAYDRSRNVFVHHDSVAGLNGWHAKRLYKAVEGFMGVLDLASPTRFIECFTLQQKNGYDCGLYVTAIAKVICGWYVSGSTDKADESLWLSDLENQVDSSSVTEMRIEILRLIRGLMDKK